MVRQQTSKTNNNKSKGKNNRALVKSSNPYIRRYILSKIMENKSPVNKSADTENVDSGKKVKGKKAIKEKNQNLKKNKEKESKIQKINRSIQKPKKTAVSIGKTKNVKEKQQKNKKQMTKNVEEEIFKMSKTRSGKIIEENQQQNEQNENKKSVKKIKQQKQQQVKKSPQKSQKNSVRKQSPKKQSQQNQVQQKKTRKQIKIQKQQENEESDMEIEQNNESFEDEEQIQNQNQNQESEESEDGNLIEQESSFDYDRELENLQKLQEQQRQEEEEWENQRKKNIKNIKNIKNNSNNINNNNFNLKKLKQRKQSDNESEKIENYQIQQKKRSPFNYLSKYNVRNQDQQQNEDEDDSEQNYIEEDIDMSSYKQQQQLILSKRNSIQEKQEKQQQQLRREENFQTPQKKQPVIEILDSSNQTINSDNKTIYRKKFRSEKAKNWFTIDSPVLQSSVTISPSNKQNGGFFDKYKHQVIQKQKNQDQEEFESDSETDTKKINNENYNNNKIINLEKFQEQEDEEDEVTDITMKMRMKNRENRENQIIKKYGNKEKSYVKDQIPTKEMIKIRNNQIQQQKYNFQQKMIMMELQKEINDQQEYIHKISKLQKQQQQQFFTKSRRIGQSIIKNQQFQQQSFIKIDMILCVDATSTMTAYIQKCKDIVIHNFQKCVKNRISLRMGIVFYRDHPPEDSTFVTKHLDLNSNLQQCLEFIDSIEEGQGGGDVPEAVMDGIWDGLKLSNWRKRATKYLIHIGDAPPHGDMYTGVDNYFNRSFMWKEGCPCNITIEKISKILNQNDIRYRLVKIGDQMQRMSKIFKQYINTFKEIKIQSEQNLEKFISGMLLQENLFVEDID